jgi:exo-beta-1,3-glucanase (GH17 family)
MGNYVRVYSVAHVPCNLDGMVRQLLASGLKVVPSAFLCGGCTASNATEVSDLVALLKSLSADDLSKIPFVVIGNEAVSFHGMTWGDNGPNDLKPIVLQVKAQVPSSVKVTTAEIYYQYLAPTVQPCQGNNGHGPTDLGNTVDLVFVNIFPFQEGLSLNQAVTCILNVYGSLNNAYPLAKPIVISETGWPSLTSVSDQQAFWQSFVTSARQNNIEYFGFEAFDESWKSPPPVEATWGLWSAARLPKAPCGLVSLNPIATHAFDGNNKSDVAWRDTSGNAAVWLMNGAQLCSAAGIGTAPTVWSVVGQRDFDGDGKADWLWRDTSGNVAMWFFNGTQVTRSTGVGNVPAVWSVAGTGDFNGDGKGDILWHDAGGNVAAWLMSGAQVLQSTGVGNVPTAWTIVGTGDFNGDGKSDVLWRDASGNVAVWLMNGAQVLQSAGVGNVPTAWTIVGTGDFNGDGKSDVLWRDANGDVAIWLMNGAQVAQSAGVGSAPTTWSIAETGDFNGDGKSDILWRDTSGNVAMWLMSGTQVVQSTGVGSVPVVWSIQGANAD